MKKTIYICDYCGKEILNNVWTFLLGRRWEDGDMVTEDLPGDP